MHFRHLSRATVVLSDYVPRFFPRPIARGAPRQNTPQFLDMFGLKLACFLAVVSLFASSQTAPDPEMRQEITRALLCLVGALCGGFLGMSWKPGATIRQNLFLIFVNVAAGIGLSPLAVELIASHYGLRAGLPLCLATGCAVASFFVLIARACIPLVLEKVAKWTGNKLPDQPPRF